MVSCVVCGISQTNNRHLSFHNLPTDKRLRKKWLNFLHKEEKELKRQKNLFCSLHFKESAFDRSKSRTRLREDAVPTITVLRRKYKTDLKYVYKNSDANVLEVQNDEKVYEGRMEENFKNNADVSEDEESKIQIENLHDTCRICLTVARNMKSLRNSGWHEIQDCANIKLKNDDGLPTKLCPVCHDTLMEFHRFKEKIENSDRILKSFVKKHLSNFKKVYGSQKEEIIQIVIENEDEREVKEETDGEQDEDEEGAESGKVKDDEEGDENREICEVKEEGITSENEEDEDRKTEGSDKKRSDRRKVLNLGASRTDKNKIHKEIERNQNKEIESCSNKEKNTIRGENQRNIVNNRKKKRENDQTINGLEINDTSRKLNQRGNRSKRKFQESCENHQRDIIEINIEDDNKEIRSKKSFTDALGLTKVETSNQSDPVVEELIAINADLKSAIFIEDKLRNAKVSDTNSKFNRNRSKIKNMEVGELLNVLENGTGGIAYPESSKVKFLDVEGRKEADSQSFNVEVTNGENVKEIFSRDSSTEIESLSDEDPQNDDDDMKISKRLKVKDLKGENLSYENCKNLKVEEVFINFKEDNDNNAELIHENFKDNDEDFEEDEDMNFSDEVGENCDGEDLPERAGFRKVCQYCSTELEPDLLNTHIRSKECRTCDACGETFPNPDKMLYHRLLEHDVKSFQCSICSELCYSESSLSRHLKNHDSDNHYCYVCKHKFGSRKYLLKHLKRHTKQPHICEKCGNLYKSYESYRSHIKRSHEQKAIFMCPHCEKVFRSHYGWTRHIKKHHFKEENWYKCSDCDRTFMFVDSLKKHKLITHNDKSLF